jgi:predicted nucleic acid-binding protein
VVIVDTTVWLDYLNGVSTPEVEWFEREAARQRLGLLDLMLCEILQGLSTDDEAARILRHLRRFEIFETGGVDLAARAARNYRRLRARGKTVRKTIDCLIATFCIEHDHALLHCDRDFDAFEKFLKLEVVHPGATETPRTKP